MPQVRSDQVVEAGKWVGTRHLRIIVGSNCAQHAVLAVPGRQSPDPVAMPRMWETNVTTMLSVGHAAEPRYRGDSEMARQKRGAAGFFWLSLIVATAMSEDAPSKPSPRRMRSTGRGRNPSADLTNEGSLTAPNEPTTAPLCGRAPRRWYSTASLSQTNDHPLRTRAIMSAMSTFGRRHPVHRRALRQVAHRQPDDHVVSRDAVRHYISRFFRGDQ